MYPCFKPLHDGCHCALELVEVNGFLKKPLERLRKLCEMYMQRQQKPTGIVFAVSRL